MRKPISQLLICLGCLLIQDISIAQNNLLSNPGFESTSIVDSWDARGTVTLATDQVIQGTQSAALSHGNVIRSSGFSQQVDGLIPSRSYLFSVNVRFQFNRATASLIVRGEDGVNLTSQNFRGAEGIWEKIQVKFTVPENISSVRVFLRSVQTRGRMWFDNAELIESGGGGTSGANWIANEDFEDDSNWNLPSNASLSTIAKRFGQRALRIVSTPNAPTVVSQFIALNGRAVDPSEPIYTLSAHIRTSGTVPLPEQDIDWFAFGHRLPQVSRHGAGMRVDFLNGRRVVRTIYSPFFFSKATRFTERKFSFLAPASTTGMRVSLMASPGRFRTYFDNVRLTGWQIPRNQVVSDVGVQKIEAPESGTYVSATPSEGLQLPVDLVSNPSHQDYGKIVWAQPGSYVHPELLLHSRTHLKLHPDSVLTKAPNPNALTTHTWWGANVKSAIFGTPISDVVIEGGTLDNQFQGDDQSGSVVSVFGDRIIVRNVNIPRHGKAQNGIDNFSGDAIQLMGHHTYVYNNSISGPKSIFGQDGIHLWGGTHSHIMSNQVLVGDDGLGLFTATVKSPFNILFDRDIAFVEAYNNRFDSVGARSVGLGFAVPRSDRQGNTSRLRSFITGVRIRNFDGNCGGVHGLVVVICSPAVNDFTQPPPRSLRPQIRNVFFENAQLQGKLYNSTRDPRHPNYDGGSLDGPLRLPPFGIRVFTDDVGAVSNVRFNNIAISDFEDRNDFSAAIDVSKNGRAGFEQPNQNINFQNCIVGAADQSPASFAYHIFGTSPFEVNDLENPRWRNQILNPGPRFFFDQ